MPKKQNTTTQRAREAARRGTKYTQALRNGAGYHPAAGTTATASEDDRFGGHEFEYEQVADLLRCAECRVYEVVARDTDGPIKLCTGPIGYDGDNGFTCC
ncbi:hypothetical protein [Microtetraspora malaysiensis]|uniref:Uncharacterized protein n=1 Tax=Microtetraspora malaysiensis TaxID=161358 RepID=A0ABW6T149_9ACTN